MENAFYDKDGNSIVYDLDKKISNGAYGNIYKINSDECIKLYYKFSYSNQEYVIQLIKEMKLGNMYDIHNLLYNNNHNLIGYTMKYYEEYYSDLFLVPMDYLITNFCSIYDIIKQVSKANVIMNDTNPKNVILTSDKIMIIDIDQYTLVKLSGFTENIYQDNTRRVYDLFIDLFLQSFKNDNFEYNYRKSLNKLSRIFNYNNSVSDVCKKLVKYKYPIDILEK